MPAAPLDARGLRTAAVFCSAGSMCVRRADPRAQSIPRVMKTGWAARNVIMFAALRAWPILSKGLQLIRTLRDAGVPIFEAARRSARRGASAAIMVERAAALHFTSHGKAHRIEAEVILLHQGVVPNTRLMQALRAAHRWDNAQLCFTPKVDAWGELDVPGIFIARRWRGHRRRAGGRIAGHARGPRGGRATRRANRRRRATPKPSNLRARLPGVMRIRPFLDSLYRPRDINRIPRDGTVVCRCEEVTAGELRQFVELGCVGPNQAKSFDAAVMGPCQGRMCGLTVTEVIADARRVSPAEVGYYRIRPPIKPLTLGELAGESTRPSRRKPMCLWWAAGCTARAARFTWRVAARR